MPDDPLKQFPQNYEVGHTAISATTLARLSRFLVGAVLFGTLLACAYRGFLGGHLGLALLLGCGYVVLCAVGAYFKIT